MNRTATGVPIALTMGDPAGIGPEIIARSWEGAHARGISPLVAIGDLAVFERAVRDHAPFLSVRAINSLKDARFEPGCIEVIVAGTLVAPPAHGEVDAACGMAAFKAIELAIALALNGLIGAIVTAPIHKEALGAAGIGYPGHTEMLADLSGSRDVSMMLVNDEIRTVLVTIHCSLKDAITRADTAANLRAICRAHDGARAYGVERPRVAVAGLNPHAGEGGLFGREEIEVIKPAIEEARAQGIDASGPWPGDTVFMAARRGEFDVVVAQYHDQGLIPIKYLGIENGVNVTLGLPFVRTSPDHGTAFDIAGKGLADPRSLMAALSHAARLSAARSRERAFTP